MTLSTGRPPISRKAGFTLLELLLVVLILSVIVAASFPRFQGTFENLKIRTAAHNLHSLILYCRERAILDRQFYRIVYDKKEKVLRVEKKEKEHYVSVAGGRGKPLKFEDSITLTWRASGEQLEFGPEGEMEKGELILSLGKERRFTIKVGEPLGRIAFEEAR